MRLRLWRILLALALLVAGVLLRFSPLARMIILLLAYAVAGYDVLFRALSNISRGQVFDENFLMALAVRIFLATNVKFSNLFAE